MDVSGIRKIEITYNQYRNDYHPHLHILIDKDAGEELKNEWIKRNPTCNPSAQQNRKTITENTFKELFKYTTKFESNADEIFVNALDVIFQSLYGIRSFQPFGKIKKQTEEVTEMELTSVIENLEKSGLNFQNTNWVWSHEDWLNSHIVETINPICGNQYVIRTEYLTGFKAKKELQFFYHKTNNLPQLKKKKHGKEKSR